MACAMHGMGYGPVVPDVAHAKLELPPPQGRFTIFCGVSDMGQGNGATFMQIAGSLLKQNPSTLNLVLPDTEQTLPCGSSTGFEAYDLPFGGKSDLLVFCYDRD